jgi:radical SAM protein with 4Fe4S-binding SPASM domain
MGFFKKVKSAVGIASKVPAGLYTYRGKGEFARLALQLRVEHDGKGLLVINANTVLYLNETATTHAFFFMQGMSTEEAVKKIKRIYRVDREVARKDHEHLIYTVSTLAQTEEVCPISFLDVKKVEPFTEEISAPIRMDLALTFRCQNDCVHCYTGGPHETPELTTEQWKKIIDKLKNIGIFLLTFTGGEPTLREDLPELLKYAQEKGAVTGLITNGRRLKDKNYVQKLVDAGLDFVQVTLESHDSKVHDQITRVKGSWKETVEGIKTVVPTPIYITTNTTLNKHNAEGFLRTVEFLHELGVQAFGCNSLIHSGSAPKIASEFALEIDDLKELLPKIQAKARQLGMKFLWYTPTQYCQLNPVNLGLGVKSCSAARVNMCVGPSGEVYPCQSYFERVGNILTDHWEKIWNHPLCASIRKREYAPDKCAGCPDLTVCGGGCPLELQEKEYLCAESQ